MHMSASSLRLPLHQHLEGAGKVYLISFFKPVFSLRMSPDETNVHNFAIFHFIQHNLNLNFCLLILLASEKFELIRT